MHTSNTRVVLRARTTLTWRSTKYALEYAVPSYPQVKGKIRYAYSLATRVGVLLDEYAHIEYP
jgi:hypothetical protein